MERLRRLVQDYGRGSITQTELLAALIQVVDSGNVAECVAAVPPDFVEEVKGYLHNWPNPENRGAHFRSCRVATVAGHEREGGPDEDPRPHRQGVETLKEYFWNRRTEPTLMLAFLSDRQGASDRKLRLFAAASFRRVPLILRSEGWEAAIEVGERHADGLTLAAETANSSAGGFWWDAPMASRLLRFLTGPAPHVAAVVALAWATGQKRSFTGGEDYAHPQELPVQAALLHDVFGNPFRPPPSIDPAWLHWSDATVVKIAQSIYDDRRFDDLPILADALEDSGCSDAEMLSHLRGPGPHARGCWVLDLLLKE